MALIAVLQATVARVVVTPVESAAWAWDKAAIMEPRAVMDCGATHMGNVASHPNPPARPETNAAQEMLASRVRAVRRNQGLVVPLLIAVAGPAIRLREAVPARARRREVSV